jgi:hypothetical protein
MPATLVDVDLGLADVAQAQVERALVGGGVVCVTSRPLVLSAADTASRYALRSS